MPKPDHDTIMGLIRTHFGPELQLACTHKRWKDGIDIDYPVYAIEAFAEAAIKNADKLFPQSLTGASQVDLRVDSAETTNDFRTLAPGHPLPWTDHHVSSANAIFILDANGETVVKVIKGDFPAAIRIVGMILCAVNTCGGFKATLES